MSYRPIGSRRHRSAAWQWGVIGFIPGLFCGLIVMIGIVLEGTLVAYLAPSPEPQVVTTVVHVVLTATEDPDALAATPQVEIRVITATPDPGSAAGGLSSVIVASSTPAPVTRAAAVAQPQVPATQAPAIAAQPADAVPEILLPLRSLAVTIPGGVFTMGTLPGEVAIAVNECRRDGGTCEASYAEDSFPAHEVLIDPFLLETTEVTFDQFVAFLNVRGPGSHLTGCAGFACIQTRNDSAHAPIIFDGANYTIPGILPGYPAYGVTWYGANEYCKAIGRRLPTEAEWERAARADDSRIYPWGDSWDNALAKTNRPADAEPGPLPVASFPLGVSVNGIHDLAGNVAEWVSDWYGSAYYQALAAQGAAENPTGPITGLEKVLRGGSWNSVPFFSRTVHRQSWDPKESQRWIGFRCAADVARDAPVGSAGLDPASLGVDVPAAPPQSTPPPNAQPTQPPAPQDAQADASTDG